jgi:hypothetical protein
MRPLTSCRRRPGHLSITSMQLELLCRPENSYWHAHMFILSRSQGTPVELAFLGLSQSPFLAISIPPQFCWYYVCNAVAARLPRFPVIKSSFPVLAKTQTRSSILQDRKTLPFRLLGYPTCSWTNFFDERVTPQNGDTPLQGAEAIISPR